MSKVLILGATGLVGRELVKICCNRDDVSVVKVFCRKKLTDEEKEQLFGTSSKLEIFVVNFEALNDFSYLIQGDILLSALGSTIKKAQSKENFFHMDHGYNFTFAKLAKKNGVNTMGIISSISANSRSSNFYLKTKGILEKDLGNVRFKKLIFVRPSFLLGDRGEKRIGEKIGIEVFNKLRPVMFGPLKKYSPIDAKEVANSLVTLCLTDLEIDSGLEYERKIIV